MGLRIFHQILDCANHGTIVLDQKGQIAFWSQWMAEKSGIEEEQVLAKDLALAIELAKAPQLATAIQAALVRRRSSLFTYNFHPHFLPLFRYRRGPPLYHRTTVRPIQIGAEGYCIIEIFDQNDVVEKNRYFGNLQRFSTTVLDNVPSAIVTFGLSGDIRLTNETAKELFLCPFDEEHPSRIQDFIEVRTADGSAITDLTKWQKLDLDSVEPQGLKSDGSQFPILLSISGFFHNGEPHMNAVVMDLTTLKEQERVIIEQEDQLVSSAKLSTIGEMSAGIAHEINNPLSVVMGNLEIGRSLIEQDSPKKEIILSTLEKAAAGLQRIDRIVRGLKRLSAPVDRSMFHTYSLDTILEDTITMTAARVRYSGAELRIENHAKGLQLPCQDVEVSQVFVNLINNACDAIADMERENRWVAMELAKDANNLIVSITDSGTGIPVEIQDKILLPLFTTKEAGKGTGLGLSICRRIVENHGGQFFIDNDCPNTRFVAELPLRQK